MSKESDQAKQVDLAADIVSAYVTKNAVQIAELPSLIATVHSALRKVAQGATEPRKVELRPAVPIKKSITPDYMICLEDGKRFKSLKRHLRTAFNLTPEQYRAKWGLRDDYPMVAPRYSEARSRLARTTGLGQQRRKTGKRSSRKAA